MERFARKLVGDKTATRKKLAEIEEKIKAEIDAAVQFARDSEFPAVEEMYQDVFVN